MRRERVPVGYEIALRHAGAADLSGDRRADLAVFQIQFRFVQSRLS